VSLKPAIFGLRISFPKDAAALKTQLLCFKSIESTAVLFKKVPQYRYFDTGVGTKKYHGTVPCTTALWYCSPLTGRLYELR